MSQIKITKGDITKLQVTAIVNAANKSLLGGLGVDGAIHKAAGSELLAACKLLHGCNVGQANITRGYKLTAEYVIHTVGPKYRASNDALDSKLLANCYTNSLDLAQKHQIHSIAFPAISTGVYHFPRAKAAKIAYQTVKNWLEHHLDYEMEVVFCAYDQQTADLYNAEMQEN